MTPQWPESMPDRHWTFLSSAVDQLQQDTRIVGIAAGGSFLSDSMDEFSDLDLVIAFEPGSHESVMRDRRHIAGSLGPLLASFTGEHVGEPRLLVCLYDGAPVLHVDLKFVALPDLSRRVEDPFILWERDDRFTKALQEGIAAYPEPDPQWIEDRFWIWVQYTTARIGRGEIFEALGALSFLRTTVLGPLALLKSNARPAGVHRFERLAPQYVRDLQATIARYNVFDCLRALHACVGMYRALRIDTEASSHAAEEAAMQYLSDVERRCALTYSYERPVQQTAAYNQEEQ